jgi:hypothetical protein
MMDEEAVWGRPVQGAPTRFQGISGRAFTATAIGVHPPTFIYSPVHRTAEPHPHEGGTLRHIPRRVL